MRLNLRFQDDLILSRSGAKTATHHARTSAEFHRRDHQQPASPQDFPFAAMASAGQNKRKTDADTPPLIRKRVKIYDARTLAVQSSDTALSKTGELDVAAFVAARQFEVRALEAGIKSSRSSLSSRAFQKVPRNLRRRTASHNVKRVPQRLRARARREVRHM